MNDLVRIHGATRIRREAHDFVLDSWSTTQLSEQQIAEAANLQFGTRYSRKTVNNVVSSARKDGDPRAVYRRKKAA